MLNLMHTFGVLGDFSLLVEFVCSGEGLGRVRLGKSVENANVKIHPVEPAAKNTSCNDVNSGIVVCSGGAAFESSSAHRIECGLDRYRVAGLRHDVRQQISRLVMAQCGEATEGTRQCMRYREISSAVAILR